MFTGIIEHIGRVEQVSHGEQSCRLTIMGLADDENYVNHGDSIAVNGACLTVAQLVPDGFVADVMPETMERTSLKNVSPGAAVNLERALPAAGRFDGHIVSGHIDGTGVIEETESDDNAVWVKIRAAAEIMGLVVYKGSIAVDGVSLTVARLDEESFQVSLIPYTVEQTVLLRKDVGETVNLECDMIGKYVHKFLSEGVGRLPS